MDYGGIFTQKNGAVHHLRKKTVWGQNENEMGLAGATGGGENVEVNGD